ncbi:MAG: hypothetical protein IJ664_01445 [Clostridia bacterium]|nr:hypothetical protein [Clostridia bacterium]
MATTKKPIESKTIAKSTTHTQTPVQIIAGKPVTCEKDGCKPLTQCPECGKIEGGEVIKAKGHKFGAWIDIQKPTCTQEGIRYRECSNTFCDNIAVEGFGHRQQEKTAAFGHRATWKTTKEATATEAGFAELKCDICGTLLASQIYYYGQTAPSGTVSTANNVNISAKSTNLVKQDPTGISATKTAPATKTNTKSTATKSTTKSTTSTASTKTAAAAPAAAAAAPAAKKVATVAAVKAAPAAELEPNQALLVADKHLYVVRNVAGEEIVLTVNIVDGKITVEAKLAEGESLVLYANAEAIENPTAENTLVLTANEAVELPEAFLSEAIVAVVKTESLPTALAAK